ncbi:cytoplasmic copper homeostasis protein CutC [Nonlabens tegetincola]|uniref:PF03932 family protein CutC n=1 Tax=Nonlabens tegetincola TaxID=323273 RepID=A0A090Q5C2_9FLAO|nr:copper homeostasis protein CutC [Nonlabens tegetincola]GAK98294.1 cytoplasmic copper homeostasis protein CutC [Nonlabens tegetincola]
MLLEICAANYQSAINAQKAGAHRIELCSELAVGGITPSFGLLKKVIADLNIPVMVLIRPRSGDFVYSKAEFEIMKQDIQLCKELGAAGIVSGVLTSDFKVDIKRTSELIELSRPLPFTFHRAFDHVENPQQALIDLINLGAHRILSSGQQASAFEGISLLMELQQQAGDELIIMPGGGINASNSDAFAKANFKEIHASATAICEQTSEEKVPMNTPKFLQENIEITSNIESIKAILNRITHEI